MTKAEWISTIKHTLMKIDETGIYREPLLEKHIQSVYEQMYNELYRRDKRGMSKYTSIITQAISASDDFTSGVEITTKPISLPRYNGGVFGLTYSSEATFDDWYLPSRLELQAIMTNLVDYNIGDYERNSWYFWSSTQAPPYLGVYNQVWVCRILHPEDALDLGYAWSEETTTKNNDSTLVIPIRSFTDIYGEYSLRDVGPAGGYIFYIDGTTCYEAKASSGYDSATAWSNIDDVNLVGTSGAVGDGYANTQLIVGQSGHTESAAQDCLDYTVDYAADAGSFILTDYPNYLHTVNNTFDTSGIMGSFTASILGHSLYAKVPSSLADSSFNLYIRMIPKFTALSSTDEVIIPEGHEEMFVDRIIDTVRHMTPTDLINDNAIQ